MGFFLVCSKKGTELFIYTFISIKAFPPHPVAACMCHVISCLAASRGLSRLGGCLPATETGICAQQSSSLMGKGCLLSSGADSPHFPGQDPSPRTAAVCAAPCAAHSQSGSAAGLYVADPGRGRKL